jgi:hypothetical protein
MGPRIVTGDDGTLGRADDHGQLTQGGELVLQEAALTQVHGRRLPIEVEKVGAKRGPSHRVTDADSEDLGSPTRIRVCSVGRPLKARITRVSPSRP